MSRATQEHSRHLKQQGKGALTRYGRTFQIVTPDAGNTERRSYYPAPASPQVRFGLFPGRSPLLGESLLFSSPRGTKMFQFPRFASPAFMLGIPQKGVGCPIRKSAHQRSFAPTRGLSQLITSFIASVSQGIHHAPLLTFCFAGPVASNADGAARTFCRLTFSTPAPHVRISWSSKDRGHADACLSQYVKDRLRKRKALKCLSNPTVWRITDSNR